MQPLCVTSGGRQTLIQLATVATAEQTSSFGAGTAAALLHWRARPGMIVTCVDVGGIAWRGRLTALDNSGGSIIPFYRLPRAVESSLKLTVYQALPDRERFELILEKLTELGITRIVPIVTRHSSTQIARDAKQRKSHHWPDVLRRAALQCRRSMIPELSPCLDLNTVLAESQSADLRLILYEGEGVTPLKDLLVGCSAQQVALLIGPEGGFAPDEVIGAHNSGFIPVSLGPRILRTETAAISAATVIQFALGDLY